MMKYNLNRLLPVTVGSVGKHVGVSWLVRRPAGLLGGLPIPQSGGMEASSGRPYWRGLNHCIAEIVVPYSKDSHDGLHPKYTSNDVVNSWLSSRWLIRLDSNFLGFYGLDINVGAKRSFFIGVRKTAKNYLGLSITPPAGGGDESHAWEAASRSGLRRGRCVTPVPCKIKEKEPPILDPYSLMV